MIQLYPSGQTDFSARGIELKPSVAEVTWEGSGRYDLSITIPREQAQGIAIDYGMIIRCTVPRQQVAEIHLGRVSYYTVNSDETPLYSKLPSWQKVSYDSWTALRSYMAGDKVSYGGKNWQANTGHGGRSVAPPDGGLWRQISGTREVPGTVIVQLAAGARIMKTADYNATYCEAVTADGKAGYIALDAITAQGGETDRVVPAFTIREQNFMITSIEKEEQGHGIRIEAEHVSYQLGRTMLGECVVNSATPATALLFIAGAMKEPYGGNLYTDLNDGSVTGDWSWKNAQAAILDPKDGLMALADCRMIRDGLDVYILSNPESTPVYQVTYGTNLKNVKWTGDVDGIITRVYPLAQREDGSTLLLPEEHIDTVRTVPFVRPESLKTGLKIGQKEKDENGEEHELTEDEVLTRMRQAAQNRFTVDKCDKAEVTLELDWVHMPATEEYKQYAGLQDAAPGDWVRVKNGPMGLDMVIQMTGYTYDVLRDRYRQATFGDKKVSPSVASYDLQSGAVTGRALAAGSVGGSALMADSITAREIEAGSITAEKIASKVITTELLAAGAVTADEIAANSVTAEKIAAGSVTAEKIQSGSITTVLLAADAVTADKIAAGAVNAEKIDAGAVTAQKIAASAVSAEKIAAGAVTADKIAAGAIRADAIDAQDLAAINAKLGTASIASAVVASADIDYAKVKDLNAQSAYFGQAVFQDAVGGKLYVPRLSVGYAQMIGATIGDLCIQASNGKYYGIDVDLAGNVTATERTVSQVEIDAGHTLDGRTLVLGTDIVATDLNTENIYASHALMDQITAAIINVDQLFAREATISKINAMDLSSNTYIRSTIGDWLSGSTITQTINSLDSRISSLGYGTVYMQPDEPSHSELVSGDIWIQTLSDGSWSEVYDQYDSWQQIYNDLGSWQVLGAVPKMWVWDGNKWQLMYDAQLPTTLETEIRQLQDEITLRATKAELDVLSGQVTESEARITILAGEIESAVSTVNAKAASFVMWEDPREFCDVSLGDIWVRGDQRLASWESVYNNFESWEELYGAHDRWMDYLGDETYVWDGTDWILTSDRASEIWHQTKIIETDRSVTVLAESTATLQDNVVSMRASISVTDSRITQEVERATQAEAGKIEKTSQYQTADSIVTEAVRQSASSASGLYLAKTSTYQTADSIVSEAVRQAATSAEGAYLKKTTAYQSADSIVTEAVRASGVNASNNYLPKTAEYQTVADIISGANAYAEEQANSAKNASIAKTASYQSAQAIVDTAVASARTAAGQTYIAKTTSYQTADAIVQAAEQYTDTNAYKIRSGVEIEAAGVRITGGKYVQIESSGIFKALAANFGIDSSAGATGYAIWAGAASGASAPFRVRPDGTVYLTKLIAVAEDGTESEVNLRTAGLWKLGYHTVKSYGQTSITLSNGATVNFNSAASAIINREWRGNSLDIQTKIGETVYKTVTETISVSAGAGPVTAGTTLSSFSNDNKGHVTMTATSAQNAVIQVNVDAGSVYQKGVTDGAGSVTVSNIEVGTISYASMRYTIPLTATASNGATRTAPFTLYASEAFNEGWNACIADAEANHAETVYTGGTWHGTLYKAPAVGAPATEAVNNCRSGQNQITRYTLPARKP